MRADHARLISDQLLINRFAMHNQVVAEGHGEAKNRFTNTPLFDRGLVVLKCTQKEDEKDPNGDYINATRFFVRGVGDIVLTQAPMENTFVDFFRMVWQLKSNIVVCLSADLNDSSEFTPYFDTRSKKKFKIGKRFIVRTLSVNRNDYGNVIYKLELRNLSISNAKEGTKDITFLHVSGWKADMPFDATRLVKSIRAMESTEKFGEYQPIIVHGTSGIRRTGCFALAMICYQELRKQKKVSLFEHILALRWHRYGILLKKSSLCLLLSVVLQMASGTALLPSQEQFAQAVRVLAAMERRLQTQPVSTNTPLNSRASRREGQANPAKKSKIEKRTKSARPPRATRH